MKVLNMLVGSKSLAELNEDEQRKRGRTRARLRGERERREHTGFSHDNDVHRDHC